MTPRACLFALLLAGWMCFALPVSHAAETVVSRVLDGTTGPISAFPEVVRIRNAANTADVATGTLITPFHVLTAASPFTNAAGASTFVAANQICLVNGVSFNTLSISLPTAWTGTNGGFHADGNPDIAIITLSTRVSGVIPAPVYRTVPQQNIAVTLAGFGKTGSGAETPGSNPPLGSIVSGFTSIENVANSYYSWVYEANEADTSTDERGAPSFITANGVRFVAGVATQREPGTEDAGHGLNDPTYHTRVDAVTTFIDSVIGIGACDLIPLTPITAPGSVRTVPGQSIPVTFTVRNQGGTASSGFTVGIFLSTDNTYSTNDIALGQIRVNAGLAAGTNLPLSGNFLLPTGIALGSYFVVLTVDLNVETTQTNYVNDTTNGLAVPSVQVIANSVPTISSPATASVLTAFIEELIVFNVGAIDVNQDALAYTWNFGDGFTASGQQVTHTYSVPGTYTATVTINDNFNGSVTSTVSITVTALSTLEFAPSKFKLDFKKLNSDSISLALRDDTVFTAADGKIIKISLGQDLLDQTTIARNKGKGIRAGKFTISGGRTLKYSTTKRDLRATLARYGAINSDVFISVPISIIVEIGTQKFGTQVPFFYVGKKDKTGQGKF